MLRQFSKKSSSGKQSKRGVILVTILFILAVAFIFITAAMLMTMGTRNRLYAKAENSQAKLTVTTVATSFLQAYQDQKINETAFTNLMNQAATNPITISATDPAAGASAGIPGMTADPDNCTKMSVTKSGSGTNTVYYVDFTTTIGTESASLRLTMRHKTPSTPSSSFQHQLQLGSGGRMENVTVGCTVASNSERYDPVPVYGHDNNTLLSLGGTCSVGGQAHVCSTWFSDSPLGGGSNFQIYSDVIFFGDDAGLNLHGISGTSFHGNGTDLYFLNRNGGSALSMLWYDNTRVDASNIGNYSYNNEWICGYDDVVFDNTQMYVQLDQNIQSSANYYSNDPAANISFGNASAESKWNALAQTYAGSAAETAAADYWDEITDNNYLAADPSLRPQNKTYDTFRSENNLTFLRDSTTPATGTTPSFPNGGGTLGPGTYILGTGDFDIGVGNKITCNLSLGKYIFYVEGDFTFRTGTLEFINGDITDPSKTAYFVIGSSGSLRFEPLNVNTHPTGIVSTNCFPAGTTEYKRGDIIQTSKPAIMVLGCGCTPAKRCVPQAGFDHVTDGQIWYKGNGNESVLTAYVNLLPTSAPSTAYGSVCGGCTDTDPNGRAGENLIFYGRLYCNQIYGGNASELIMPYCPAPDDQVSTDFVSYEPDYLCEGIAYFHA